jgi:sugar-specific transcriptional regulator TrmB
MRTDDALQAMTALGFTELEAEVYDFLLQESPATGYCVAQGIGKPVANTYKAIESLGNKGAVLVNDGPRRLYHPLPAEEFLAQLEQGFRRRRQQAATALAAIRVAPEDDRVYQLRSVEQVFQRCRRMLDGCEQVALLDAFPRPLEELRGSLEAAAARGVRVTVKAYQPADIVGAEVVVSRHGPATLRRWPGQWLNLVTDSREHLLALLTSDDSGLHQAVWSGSTYLSWVYHCTASCEVVLATLEQHLEDGATAAELRQVLRAHRFLRSLDLPGYQTLIQRFAGEGTGGPEKGR